MNIKHLLLIGAALALSSCAITDISSLPAGGKWVNMGVSANGNVLHELDTVSIKRHGNSVTFTDRKTIEDIGKEHYPHLPEHKISVNTWEMNCKTKTYRLTSTNIFNAKGKSLLKRSFKEGKKFTDNESAPMKIVKGSATEKQQQIVCQ